MEGPDGVVFPESYSERAKATGSWDGRLSDGTWAGLGGYTLRLTVAGQVVSSSGSARTRRPDVRVC